jgi:hypothetical protein
MAKYDWKLTVDFISSQHQKVRIDEDILNIPPDTNQVVINLLADEDKDGVRKGDKIIIITLSKNFSDQIKEIDDRLKVRVKND